MPSLHRSLTADEHVKVRQLIKEMRLIAQPVGPLHGFWDYIADLEGLAHGGPTILGSPEAIIAGAEAALAKRVKAQ